MTTKKNLFIIFKAKTVGFMFYVNGTTYVCEKSITPAVDMPFKKEYLLSWVNIKLNY